MSIESLSRQHGVVGGVGDEGGGWNVALAVPERDNILLANAEAGDLADQLGRHIDNVLTQPRRAGCGSRTAARRWDCGGRHRQLSGWQGNAIALNPTRP